MFIEANNGVTTKQFLAQKIKGKYRIVFMQYDALGQFVGYRAKDTTGREWQCERPDYLAYCKSLNPPTPIPIRRTP